MKNIQKLTIEGVSKILERGQVTIPKKLREELDLKKNMYVGFMKQNGEILIKPLIPLELRENTNFFFLKGVKVYKAKYPVKKAVKILRNMKRPLWGQREEKDRLLERKRLKKRMKSIDKLKPYWDK